MHLGSNLGIVIAQGGCILNVQQRLGAVVFEAKFACGLCGKPLDVQCVHGECCDVAGATRGRHSVV